MTDAEIGRLLSLAVQADTNGIIDPSGPATPYGIAKACEERIGQLKVEIARCNSGLARKKRAKIRTLRDLADWCRTRAGYVDPEATA